MSGRMTIVEIAAQLGHSPSMLLNTYAVDVIAELKGEVPVPADEQVRRLLRGERLRGELAKALHREAA
jgi:hypothetical protein